MIAHFANEAERGPHGHPMAEATSPLADPGNPDGTYRYVAGPLPVIDYAEQAENGARDAYRKKWPDADMQSLIFPVKRVER